MERDRLVLPLTRPLNVETTSEPSVSHFHCVMVVAEIVLRCTSGLSFEDQMLRVCEMLQMSVLVLNEALCC